MEHKKFMTKGVCSRQIDFDYDDGKIYNLTYVGGCNGNLKAIARLVEGQDLEKVMKILEGNVCGMKNTSCADQLAKAIKEVIDNA